MRMLCIVVLLLLQHIILPAAANPKVIIVGAGFSGISAAKTLSDAGIKDFLLLEATDRIGGRIRQQNFAGKDIEIGANWIEGVNGPQVNPIWDMAKKILLRNFYSDFANLSANIYKQGGGLYDESEGEKSIELADGVHEEGEFFFEIFTIKWARGHLGSNNAAPPKPVNKYCSE